MKPHLQRLGPFTEAKPATSTRGTKNNKSFIFENTSEPQQAHQFHLLLPICDIPSKLNFAELGQLNSI